MYSEMLLALHPPGSGGYATDALSSIHRSTRQMQAQVEDLLDFSRLQQGRLAVEPSVCDPWELFEAAESLLRPLALSRSIRFEVRGPPRADGRQRVEVDPSRFQQLISNLGGNACKFTPEGGEVGLVWRIWGPGLAVSVRDTGPGIPREHLPHVFSAFWQAGDGDGRGIGLGLWIARAIVEAHGGRIWVESEPGAGATFHFTLPGDVREGGSEDGSMGRTTHVPDPTPA
jgi:signal transduction histidine kinase